MRQKIYQMRELSRSQWLSKLCSREYNWSLALLWHIQVSFIVHMSHKKPKESWKTPWAGPKPRKGHIKEDLVTLSLQAVEDQRSKWQVETLSSCEASFGHCLRIRQGNKELINLVILGFFSAFLLSPPIRCYYLLYTTKYIIIYYNNSQI